MIVPGSNLLAAALTVIQRQVFQYIAFEGRTLDGIGYQDVSYAAPVSAYGSTQPASHESLVQLGLDLTKKYMNIFLPRDVQDVDRGSAGDQFIINDQRWQALLKTPWFGFDGWDQVLCVEIPNNNSFYITETGFYYTTEDGSNFYGQETA